jgi:hypothetical protein
MKRTIFILLVAIFITGCFAGPTGPAGEQGTPGQQGAQGIQGDRGPAGESGASLFTWSHEITADESQYQSPYDYRITVVDQRFEPGYWYDVWVIGKAGQLHIDTFTADASIYGLITVQAGVLCFDYLFDLSGYTLLIFSNREDC